MSSIHVSGLSDEALLGAARQLAGRSREVYAELIIHLHEVEERRLHLQRGFSSMYAYCMQELGFTDDTTCNVLGVARVLPQFPQILDIVRDARIHFSGLRLLAKHFTKENFDALVLEATGKTKLQIEAICTRFAPKELVPDSIRKLPPPMMRPAAVPPPAPAAASAHPPVAPLPQPIEKPELAPETVASLQRARRPRIDPLAPDAHRVQFTADDSLVALIEETRELHRHAVPDGDLATLVRNALTLYNAQLRKRRYGAASVSEAEQPVAPQAVEPVGPAPSAEPEGRYIPVAKRRSVYAKHGERCAYVSPDGRRCDSRAWLEFEHREGYARTHSHSVESLSLYCKAHNQLAAEQLFGREFMDAKRGEARQRQADRRGPERAAPSSRPPPAPRASEQTQLFAFHPSQDG